MDTQTLLEVAQHLASLSASTIRLHAGEMTAAEMRAVRAVLQWQARELMQRATGPLPKTVTATLVDGLDFRQQGRLDHALITMTHDDLQQAIGEAAKIIADAGFVLVPRTWRDAAQATLADLPRD